VHARGIMLQCGVERSSSYEKGSSALMTSQGSGAWTTSRGSDETERCWTKRRSTGGSGACPLALVLSGVRPRLVGMGHGP
jgi:hypothetical protein